MSQVGGTSYKMLAIVAINIPILPSSPVIFEGCERPKVFIQVVVT